MKSTVSLLVAASLALAATATPAQEAGEVERLRNAMLVLVRTLVDQNVISVAKAQEMLRQAGIDTAALSAATPPAPPPVAAAPSSPTAPPQVRVPYVPETVKRELREQIRQEVLAQARAERWGEPGALPSWLSRITIGGDVRVRAQHDGYGDDNDAPALIDAFYQLPDGSTRNTSEDRGRLRLRARLGVQAKVSDEVSAGLRIVTSSGGDDNNPVSTNVDLGRFNRRFGAALDLAYVGWERGPYSTRAGRIANPYFASDLMWANDLTFDGASFSVAPVFSLAWSGFATAGVHPLREVQGSPTSAARDKWLFAGQVGARWQGAGDSQARAGVALYDFRGIEGRLNPADPVNNTLYNESAPLLRQRGNTMFNIASLSSPGGTPVWGLASKFRVVNLSAGADLGWFAPWRLGVSVDWLRNVGFDRDEILARIGSAAATLPQDRTGADGVSRPRTDGFRYEVSIGHGARDLAGSWQLFAGYRELERDAVPDGFTSADYRLGGTDQKAGFFGASVNLARNTTLTGRYISAESLDLAPRYHVNTWLLDLSARF